MRTTHFDGTVAASAASARGMWPTQNPLIHKGIGAIRDRGTRYTCKTNSVPPTHIHNVCVCVIPIYTYIYIVSQVVQWSNHYGDKGLRAGRVRDSSDVVSQCRGGAVR